MSTKVYTGSRLKIVNLADLSQYLTDFAMKVEAKAINLIFVKKIEIAINALDDVAVGRTPFDLQVKFEGTQSTQDNIWTWADHVVYTHYQNIYHTDRRDPEFDFQCFINIYFLPDMILAYPNAEKSEYLDMWFALPFVEKYPYWNNTDKPTEISDAEWDTRGKNWNKAFNLKELTVKCLDYFPNFPRLNTQHITFEQAIAKFDFDGRVNKKAKRMCLDNRMKKFQDAAGPDAKCEYAWVFEAEKWMNETDEGKKALEEMKKEVAGKLKRNLTEDYLTKGSE